jgi:twitching motility protein PilT
MHAGMREARCTRRQAGSQMHIDDLLRLAVERKASDLHLKAPQPPVFRVEGDLVFQTEMPKLTPADISGVLEWVSTPAQREAFSRDHELDIAYSFSGVGRFRVNVCLQRGSLAMSFRPIPLNVPQIDGLGLPEIAKTLALKPRGLVLVTGPTGHGKSTTLAAMVDYINENRRCRIVTVEDPIEFLHRDKASMVVQRELGIDTHSFATALKHVLRQDPDVILIGEMRDLPTMQAALTAAETGHLVLGTLHTVSAVQTVDRIIDVFPPYQQPQVRLQLSTLLEGVLCQTLLPRVGGGRILAVEVMIGSPAVGSLIREGKTHQLSTVLQTSAQAGMQTLDHALKSLYQKKQITLHDAMSKANSPDELKRLIGVHGL